MYKAGNPQLTQKCLLSKVAVVRRVVLGSEVTTGQLSDEGHTAYTCGNSLYFKNRETCI